MSVEAIEDIKRKIEALKAYNLDQLKARTTLFAARIDLEDMADAIARETDADGEVVLLIIRATWMVYVQEDLPEDETPDPEAFKAKVEAGVRTIIDTLANAKKSAGDEILDKALEQAVAAGKRGDKIIPVRDVISQVRTMIPTDV